MVRKPLFSLGDIFLTQKAKQACIRNKVDYYNYLARHCSGDWGEVGNYAEVKLSNTEIQTGNMEDTAKLNVWLLKCRENGSIMSSYLLDDNTKIWIITTCNFCKKENHTTILLPSDY